MNDSFSKNMLILFAAETEQAPLPTEAARQASDPGQEFVRALPLSSLGGPSPGVRADTEPTARLCLQRGKRRYQNSWY